MLHPQTNPQHQTASNAVLRYVGLDGKKQGFAETVKILAPPENYNKRDEDYKQQT